MTNRNGMTVKVTNYGASLTFVSAPDKEGVFAPVVLGLDSLRYYLGRQPKLGATVGRYANRIRNAELVLNDGSIIWIKTIKGIPFMVASRDFIPGFLIRIRPMW